MGAIVNRRAAARGIAVCARRATAAGVLPAVMLLAWSAGCKDTGAPGPTGPTPTGSVSGFIVSGPVGPPSAASRAMFSSAGSAALGTVYVSLAPGSAPTGVAATIRNRTRGTAVQAYLFAGGFDPVSLPADVGDTLDLDVRDAGGASILAGQAAVRAARPPVVVRTDPPPKKMDVPLNSIVVVVFSEPIDPRTVTTNGLQLVAGTAAVSGRITVAANGLSAEFAADQLLQPSTTYTLSLTDAVADPTGALLEPSTSDFVTASSSAGVGTSEIAFTGCPQSLNPPGTTPAVCGLFAMNADGADLRQLSQPLAAGDVDGFPTWSPDGSHLAFDSYRHCVLSGRTPQAGCQLEIYVMNADGSGVTRLTNLDSLGIGAQGAAWSPDGRTIAFPVTANDSSRGIYAVNPDGSGLRILTASPTLCYRSGGPAWSPDGARIAFSASTPATCGTPSPADSGGIWVMNADGSNVTRITTGYWDGFPSWSPDGTKIAFQGTVNGDTRNQQIFVAGADGSNPTQLTTATPGTGWRLTPSWSPDGTQIAFKIYASTTFPDGSRGEIAVMRADGSGAVSLVTPGFTNVTTPTWSLIGTVPPLPAAPRAMRRP